MTEFEKVLQECLLTLEQGDSNVEECLSRYPNHALQLEPILLTSVDLERGREVRPSAAFKARVRAKLTQEMRAHPRKTLRFHFLFARMATSFAAIVLALFMAGTAYAQSVLPGNAFYEWKLLSENVLRAVAPDPVGVDLVIAARRSAELIAVGDNLGLRAQVLEAYLEVVTRLQSEMNAGNEARIRSVLDSQIEELNNSGIPIIPGPAPDQDVLPPVEEPTIIPTSVPQETPLVTTPTAGPVTIQVTAPVKPTDLPRIVPTIEAPTVEVPPLPHLP